MSEEASLVPAPTVVAKRKRSSESMPAVVFGLSILGAPIVALGALAWPLGSAYLAVMIAWLAVTTVRSQREHRRFMAANTDGLAAHARGELGKARDIFWHWAETTKPRRLNAIARHNLAWTLMRQGELQQSIDVLLDNEARNADGLKQTGLSPTSAIDLALVYALLGNAATADTWFAETETRKGEVSQPTIPAMKLFVRAVVACRGDRPGDAARLLDDRWAECEATLTGETSRPLRIVHAFALAAAGPRDAGRAETIVAAARPAYPGEYTFLGTAWPEMATFLASHGL